jgi:hypothetical protein
MFCPSLVAETHMYIVLSGVAPCRLLTEHNTHIFPILVECINVVVDNRKGNLRLVIFMLDSLLKTRDLAILYMISFHNFHQDTRIPNLVVHFILGRLGAPNEDKLSFLWKARHHRLAHLVCTKSRHE